ncbi:Shewanella-like protein phosphatase 1 [Dichanthelium oligosanthes]|uniref:Shewanella-like protein phosphatase 1 n=1 Tax=Dichanthelium oligosanthes TaxID=888268 RepID=A0A1E5UW81_9POAL|nr:Shewanella-like protein phosphatase 1 [Dichanthelium oligosanthes]
MVVLSLRLGFVAPPYPRNSNGRLAFSASSCRAVANGGVGPARPITVAGDPPTVVSAPGRRIVASTYVSSSADSIHCQFSPFVLVQVGDILDRGEDEIAILSLLRSLNAQAKSHGGAVFQVNGNHETMNVEGDFRYVDPGGFDECIRFLEYLDECDGNWDDAFLNWVNVTERRKKEYRALPNGDWHPWNFVKKQKGFAARSSLFKRVEYGIERMNREVSMWMKYPSVDSDDETDIPFIATRGYDSVLSSIVADQTLKSVGAKGMVVGHTPQMHGVNWYLSSSNLNWRSFYKKGFSIGDLRDTKFSDR